MQSFTKIINNRLNNLDLLNESIIGLEFEFYSKMSFYKTLESLNQEFSTINIHGFRTYHSDFEVTEKNWKLEPDYSGGPNMAELITGPIKYQDARIYLTKILKWLQENASTDDRCALHINVGYNKGSHKNIERINPLKLLLNVDEQKILRNFEDRKNNIYSKSILNIIPFKGYDFSDAPPSAVASALMMPDTKYHGINFTHINEGRLEWRYLGGKDYQYKVGEILDSLDYFVLLTNESISTSFTRDDNKKLKRYLDKNIHQYKSLARVDDFISLYPTIDLQVDKVTTYESLSAFYYKLFDKLYDLISYTENLKDCIINWDSTRNIMEVVNAKIKSTYNLTEFDFINCDITDASISQSDIVNCTINSSYIFTSKISRTNVTDSKIDESAVNSSSVLYNSYFMSGKIDGEMKGGVLRSGRLGPNARISTSTKILTDDNFFNIKPHTNKKDKTSKITKLKS